MGSTIGAWEWVISGAIALGLGVWQLVSVNRAIKKSDRGAASPSPSPLPIREREQ